MPFAAIITLVLAALVVGALVRYLGRVVLLLRGVEHDLRDVIDVLWKIEEQTAPVDRGLSAANLDLTAAHAALRDGLASLAGDAATPRR